MTELELAEEMAVEIEEFPLKNKSRACRLERKEAASKIQKRNAAAKKLKIFNKKRIKYYGGEKHG